LRSAGAAADRRVFQIGIFDSRIGGDPVFQHFFWFYSHPAVYHDSAGHGDHQRNHSDLQPQTIFGYRAVRIRRIAGARLYRWGPSPVL
jgi:cytochrome c oxidase subunit 1